MVAWGKGRSPMTSSDAETDSKPIIIIIIYYKIFASQKRGGFAPKKFINKFIQFL